jgi:hypothetical protein
MLRHVVFVSLPQMHYFVCSTFPLKHQTTWNHPTPSTLPIQHVGTVQHTARSAAWTDCGTKKWRCSRLKSWRVWGGGRGIDPLLLNFRTRWMCGVEQVQSSILFLLSTEHHLTTARTTSHPKASQLTNYTHKSFSRMRLLFPALTRYLIFFP